MCVCVRAGVALEASIVSGTYRPGTLESTCLRSRTFYRNCRKTRRACGRTSAQRRLSRPRNQRSHPILHLSCPDKPATNTGLLVCDRRREPLDKPAPNFNAELPIFIADPKRDGPAPRASAAQARCRRHAWRTERRRRGRKDMEIRIVVPAK